MREMDNTAEKKTIETMASVSGLNKESREAIIMKELEMQHEKQRRGIIDKLFGQMNTKIYIAGLLCIMLIITGIIKNDGEYWNSIIPLIGTTIGYIFGKGIN